ncbi:MFS general substrate transporter [Thozetella sp. PMI_491]|nr:MFS general substrate transporter [Thozetella sp. PMI_491]
MASPTTNSSDKEIDRHVSTEEAPPARNSPYYEKDGLRTYGDDVDHDHEPPMTFRRFMSFVAMAFLWTGSQIPVYLFGGVPPLIYGDIGGVDRWIWFVTGNLLGSAGICPFVGALSDLLGRRWVAVVGITLVIIGQIVCSTAQVMNTFIGGMVISGVGAGINELTALAGTAELAPTSKRGFYVSILIFTIVPFCPSVMWAQLIATHAGWRYIGVLTTVWCFLGLVSVLVFYFPPPRVNSLGLSKREIFNRIDFIGGFLSIAGIVLFVAGLLWGGYQYDWTSAHTLVPLLLGVVILIIFVCWEIWGAKYPMIPKRLGQAKWNLNLTFVITFISGANFFSVLLLWPTQAFNVYGHDPVGVGIRGMPFGFCVMGGACITLYLLSKTGGQIKWLLFGASVLMTAGCGSLAAARMDNINAVYGFLALAGLGVGGIVVPASILSTIISPDDLIATISALTLAIRVVGGAVGYTVYYNVFYNKLVPTLINNIAGVMIQDKIFNITIITEAIELTGASLIEEILPLVGGNETQWEHIVLAGQMAYADSYPWVYYCSIAFGGVSIIASLLLTDISKYMDDHVAVVIA